MSLARRPQAAAGVASSSPAVAWTSAEILRLSEAGMGVDALGARFRLAYAQINRIVAEEQKRRADAWARDGGPSGCRERPQPAGWLAARPDVDDP